MLFSKKAIRFYLLPLIGGLLYSTGFPTKFLPLNFLGPILGLALLFNAHPLNNTEIKTISLGQQLKSVLAFCLAANLLSYYWIPKTIGIFGNIPLPFNFILGLFFTLIVLPHLIIFTIIYRKLFLIRKTYIKNDLIFFLLISLTLCLFETYIPQQFPAHTGHSWIIIAPYLSLAPIFGVPTYSLISIFLAINLPQMFLKQKIILFPIIVFIVFLLINISSPLELGTKDLHTDHIRLVQADIGSLIKVDSEHGKSYATNEVIDAYTELSLKDSKEELDLIIWPETAYPNMIQSELIKKSPYLLPKIFRYIINKTGSELLVGGYDYRTQDYNSYFFESQYNAVFHFSTNVELKNIYRKMKLIPFGESLPFGVFNKTLAKYIQNISYFAAGKEYPIFETKNKTRFFVAICYEILFSNFIKNYLNNLKVQPRFMVNITNDSWYGDTSEPFQHLYLARWRSLEFNIPIIRSTNTGITSVLYPDGSESTRINIHEKKVMDISLKTPLRDSTIYEKYGIWLTILITFILIVILSAIPLLRGREDE